MGKESIKSNLRSVKEFVLDEQRLVTYISLSKELCMHVNDTKILLAKLVEDIKCNNPKIKLNVKYILSGLLENNGARTLVCSEEEIETRKNEFKNVFFQHIYSVGQGLPSEDTSVLVAANKFDDIALCTGLIKSKVCLKHSSEEIGTLKSNSSSNLVPNVEQVHNQQKKDSKVKVNEVVKKAKVENVESTSKAAVNKSEPMIKSEVSSPKKELSSTKTQAKKNGIKTSKSIAGFFARDNNTSSTKTAKGDNGGSKEPIKIEKEPIAEIKVEKMDIEESGPVSNGIKTNSKTETKNKSLKAIKKNAKVDNKRKRVLHVSDSESDNEKEKDDPFADEPVRAEHDSDDEIPPTPQPNTVKITSGIVNPKKRRKIVDKTYTDEEGYILTKKEEVYESCSDNEDVSVKENVEQAIETKPKHVTNDEVSPKEKKTKNSKKKVSPPQKGKQATLMTFFKKVPNKG